MTNEEIFDQWCPATSRWATWAKPVLFAQPLPLDKLSSLHAEWKEVDVSWASNDGMNTAIVIDLPGTAAIVATLALAKVGFQPVPLFNCCAAAEHEVLPTGQIREYLVHGAYDLQQMPLSSTALPAFVLDSDRLDGKNIPKPGKFDNRWMTFPQDFPSATFLKEAGITKVILVQANYQQPETDLAQVLIRWQEAGIEMFSVTATNLQAPRTLTVKAPPRYRWFFQRALALVGWRQNSAGGFGSVIPEPGGGAG